MLLPLIAGSSLIALLGSYLGAIHPAGDTLAVFRPAWALIMLISASFMGGWRRVAGVILSAVTLAPILWATLRPVPLPRDGLVLYLKNLRFDLADPGPVVADIRASDAGVVLLEEVSRRNLAVPEALLDSHPHQLICPAHRVGAVAILSRRPFLQTPDCAEGSGFAAARIAGPEGPVSLAVTHLHWPWPHGQAGQVAALLPRLRTLPRPVILGGDFNMVPWGYAVGKIADATGTRHVGPLRSSLVLKGLYPLVIDHVLMPEGWAGRLQMRDRLGSDHRGVLARLAPR